MYDYTEKNQIFAIKSAIALYIAQSLDIDRKYIAFTTLENIQQSLGTREINVEDLQKSPILNISLGSFDTPDTANKAMITKPAISYANMDKKIYTATAVVHKNITVTVNFVCYDMTMVDVLVQRVLFWDKFRDCKINYEWNGFSYWIIFHLTESFEYPAEEKDLEYGKAVFTITANAKCLIQVDDDPTHYNQLREVKVIVDDISKSILIGSFDDD